MRTHLRRDVAQKSGPTPNREQLRVFYNADEKTGYILINFNYYRKVHSTAILTSRGTLFGAMSRRRYVRISRVFISFSRGLLLRLSYDVDSTIPARLLHKTQHCNFWDTSFTRTLLTVEWVQLTQRAPHMGTSHINIFFRVAILFL